jgi:hypothetical protein
MMKPPAPNALVYQPPAADQHIMGFCRSQGGASQAQSQTCAAHDPPANQSEDIKFHPQSGLSYARQCS